jgi:hypothetical protein
VQEEDGRAKKQSVKDGARGARCLCNLKRPIAMSENIKIHLHCELFEQNRLCFSRRGNAVFPGGNAVFPSYHLPERGA